MIWMKPISEKPSMDFSTCTEHLLYTHECASLVSTITCAFCSASWGVHLRVSGQEVGSLGKLCARCTKHNTGSPTYFQTWQTRNNEKKTTKNKQKNKQNKTKQTNKKTPNNNKQKIQKQMLKQPIFTILFTVISSAIMDRTDEDLPELMCFGGMLP